MSEYEYEDEVTELQKAAFHDPIVRKYCLGKITADEAIVMLSRLRRHLGRKLYKKICLSTKPIQFPEHLDDNGINTL